MAQRFCTRMWLRITKFVEPPKCPNMPKDVCWDISKALCGLISAPRSWGQRLTHALTTGGWAQRAAMQSAYFHTTYGMDVGIMTVCVDYIMAPEEVGF